MALLEVFTPSETAGSAFYFDRYKMGLPLGSEFGPRGSSFLTASSQSIAVIDANGEGYVYSSSGVGGIQAGRPRAVASSSIAFITSDVLDVGALIQGLQPGVEVYVLQSSDLDRSIQQITQTLAGRSGLTSVQIFSHGTDGNLQLGKEFLNASNLETYSSSIASWSNALTADADVLFYGCNLAESNLGKDFVQKLGLLTGADIAASTDLTGSLALGANWTLEYATGQIETPSLLEPWTQNGYQHLLATFNVTNTNDSGGGSLRQAVLDANGTGGADTIAFSGDVFADQTPDTITLTTGQLTITDALVIAGPGAGLLTINANNASRAFQIAPVEVTIANLTIANGKAADVGGAIVNSGSLAVVNTTFNNNSAAQVGGAIANFGGMLINGGTFTNNRASIHGGAIYNAGGLEARNSNFTTNQATGDGGGIYNESGAALTIDNDFFSRNTAGNDGGGIFNRGQGSVSILTTVIVDGSAGRLGGGIANFGTISSIDNSMIRGNRSTGSGGAGGGIFNGGTVNIINTSILSNTAVGPGGGIFNGGSLTLRENSLVSSNRAATGGGIYNAGTARVRESSILSNRLAVANGVGPDVFGAFISEGFNTIYRRSGSTGFSTNLGDTIIFG